MCPNTDRGTVAVRLLATCVVCCLVAWCSKPVDDVAQRVYALTIPPGGSGTPLTTTHETAVRVATWHVATPNWAWDRYSAWLRGQLQFELPSVTTIENGVLRLGRTLEGDTYSLIVRQSELPGGADGSISFTFTSRPY